MIVGRHAAVTKEKRIKDNQDLPYQYKWLTENVLMVPIIYYDGYATYVFKDSDDERFEYFINMMSGRRKMV